MKRRCQAVVLRYAPDPSSGETLNIGMMLVSPEHSFASARFVSSWRRISAAFPDADLVHLRRFASAVERECARRLTGQISLDEPSGIVQLVESIIPPDDASMIHSPALSGLTSNPQQTLDELFQRYVGSRGKVERRASRQDQEVWRSLKTILQARGIFGRLQPHTLKGKHNEEQFEAAWKNGRWNVARPLSLDLIEPREIVNKAASWVGRIITLEPLKQDTNVHLVVGLPPLDSQDEVRQAGQHGLDILEEELATQDLADVVLESDINSFVDQIADDLDHRTRGD